MAETPVRLLALDSFGTLFDVEAGLTAELEAWKAPDAREMARRWVKAARDETRSLASRKEFQPFPSVVARTLESVSGGTFSDQDRQELAAAWGRAPLFPDVRPALEDWRDLGASAWIVTNGDLAMITGLIARHGISDLIGGVVTAESARQYKPAPEIYRRLLASAGALAVQAVLISALDFDAAGAAAVGMRSAFLRRESSGSNIPPGITWTVKNFGELIDLLRPLLPKPSPGDQVY